MNTEICLEQEMREWLLECFTQESDQEEIENLTEQELIESINRYFEDGIRAFIRCL